MERQNLAMQLEYSSSKSLFVVTWNNMLKQIFCPFKVVVLKPVGQLAKDEMVWVQEVKVTQSLKTVYIINGQAYYYHYFDIISD